MGAKDLNQFCFFAIRYLRKQNRLRLTFVNESSHLVDFLSLACSVVKI